jgi:hypothetical protein
MPKSSTGGLKGGRALYRGQNSYASQGFENDTRQSQLGGLVVAYKWGDQTTGVGTPTVITFPQTYLSSTFNPLFLRGFAFNPATSTFTCRKPGTYRIFYSLDVTDLVGTDSALSRLRIFRGVDERALRAALVSAPVDRGPLITSDIVDLQYGDQFYLVATTTKAAIILGGSLGTNELGGREETFRSCLLVEQIDLPAPA